MTIPRGTLSWCSRETEPTVSSSRAILFPEVGEAADAAAWENALEVVLDRAIDELGAAVRA